MTVQHDHTQEEHRHLGYGVYVVTWLALLMLTGLTVTVAGMQLRGLSILVALSVASVKATIVVLFFMHLREENKMFKIMFIVSVVVLGIFIGMTFFDILYR